MFSRICRSKQIFWQRIRWNSSISRKTSANLYIFPREDYATIQSNRIGEILVDHGKIVEVPIHPEYFGSSKRVQQFPPDVRNCYFPVEGQKLLNQSYYSMNECLLLCRMLSMVKYCGCVTAPMVGTFKNFTTCNFLDLPCLRNWQAIWYGWNIFEYVNDNEDIKADFTSGRRCPKCLPSCNRVDFNLQLNIKALLPNYGSSYRGGILSGLNSSKPLAVVRLFFKEDTILYTEMDIIGDWVMLLNRFGGIMCLMYGFSIMSYIEILYFATGKFLISFFKSWKVKLKVKWKVPKVDKKNSQEVDKDPAPTYNLYWRELQPQRAVNIRSNIEKQYMYLNYLKN